MKVKCLKCGTIIDIEESEYPVGIEQTIECPLCQEKVSFTIKDESKTSEVLPPPVSAVKSPIKVKSRVAKSGNNHPDESSQNNQNEIKGVQQTSDESLDDKIAKWEEASQQITNNSNPLYRLAYYLGYYHDNIKKGLICICVLIVLFFVGKFFWNNYQSRPSGIKVDTDSIAELVDSISDESIVNESDSIISFLRLMYENSDYNNYPFLNGHCTQHLLSVLSEAYDYDCNESPCYATWLFRTQSQDYKSSTENESRVISVKDLGDNWFEIEFYDGGWKGIKKIKAYFKDGNIVMDMIETVYDEVIEDLKREQEKADSAQTTASGYIAELSERKLTEKDIDSFSTQQLEILRNMIFAWHGYKFNREDLNSYFSKYSWYNPATTDASLIYENLTEIEKYNVDFIKAHE